MKPRCEACQEDLTKTLETAFRICESGRLECPHCHHLQAPILLPFDLILNIQLEIFLALILISVIPVLVPLMGPELSRLLPLLLILSIFWLLRNEKRILYARIPINRRYSKISRSAGFQRMLTFIHYGLIAAMTALVIWDKSLQNWRWFLVGALIILTLLQLILRMLDRS